jgi:predicted SnoaL-like aldol condensation-catalyzing enzyme
VHRPSSLPRRGPEATFFSDCVRLTPQCPQWAGHRILIVATLTNGQLVEVLCWTTGTSVNGYNIWTRLDTADDSPQYVSDFYLDTGHVQDHLPQC